MIKRILSLFGLVKERNIGWYARQQHVEPTPLSEADIAAIREWSIRGVATSSQYTLCLIETIRQLQEASTND